MNDHVAKPVRDALYGFEDAVAFAQRVRALHGQQNELAMRIEHENQIFHRAVQYALERQAKQIEQLQEALSDRIERPLL